MTIHKSLLFTLGAVFLAALPVTAMAKGAGKANGETKEERKEGKAIFAKYDKNSNGVLDPDEKEALRTAFKTDTTLAFLDKNKDGMLDDSEIAVLKPGHKGKGKKAK